MDEKIVYRTTDGIYLVWCEACQCCHGYDSRWEFNGDFEKPTFRASMLIRSGHYLPEHTSDQCWCTYNETHPDEPVTFKCSVCHSYVTDGKMEYLSDCTHELAGKTVDLQPF